MLAFITIASLPSQYGGISTNHVALYQSNSLFGQNHYHRHHHSTTRTSLSMSDDYGNLSGLTDDGDFAILGINAHNNNDDDDDENDTVESNRQLFPNTGTSIGWQGVGNMLFSEPLLKSGNVDIGVGPSNRYRNFRGNEVLPKEEFIDPQVEEWLMEVLPSLDESEVECYAQGLSSIGFRPQCPSLCELQYDDLDFIEKVLHRRYLFKEITGESHPFEP